MTEEVAVQRFALCQGSSRASARFTVPRFAKVHRGHLLGPGDSWLTHLFPRTLGSGKLRLEEASSLR